MDYIKKYNSKEDFDDERGLLTLPNVSLVENEVFYTPKPSIKLLSYLHVDGTIDETPAADVVGICIIPDSHYGKARFMSVVRMSATNKQGTTQNETLQWEKENLGAVLKPINKFVVMSLGNSREPYLSNYGFLSTDRKRSSIQWEYSNLPEGWDQNAKYWNDNVSNIPSPFLANGSLNPTYAMEGQALADVDGYGNTKLILSKHPENYPAALACKNFSPGINDGKWYLPSLGEWGYIHARWGAINDKLQALINVGCPAVLLPSEGWFWTSTACSSGISWYVRMLNGNVVNDLRFNYYSVLAVSAF